jgi:capsid protein
MKFFAVNVNGGCNGGPAAWWREDVVVEAVLAGVRVEGTTISARSDNSWNIIAADRNALGLKLHSGRASLSPALLLAPMARSTNTEAALVRRARITSSWSTCRDRALAFAWRLSRREGERCKIHTCAVNAERFVRKRLCSLEMPSAMPLETSRIHSEECKESRTEV